MRLLPWSRLEKIGEGAFAGTLVREFVAPPSLREVGIAAFANCRNLERADLGRTEMVGDLCFWGTGLQQVRDKNVWQRPPSGISPTPARLVLPEGLRMVGRDWFSGSDIRELLVSQGVEEIQDRAFAQCRSLATVTFADGSRLRTIGAEAFAETQISELVAPESLESIGEGAFLGCEQLKRFVLDADISIPESAF